MVILTFFSTSNTILKRAHNCGPRSSKHTPRDYVSVIFHQEIVVCSQHCFVTICTETPQIIHLLAYLGLNRLAFTRQRLAAELILTDRLSNSSLTLCRPERHVDPARPFCTFLLRVPRQPCIDVFYEFNGIQTKFL